MEHQVVNTKIIDLHPAKNSRVINSQGCYPKIYNLLNIDLLAHCRLQGSQRGCEQLLAGLVEKAEALSQQTHPNLGPGKSMTNSYQA